MALLALPLLAWSPPRPTHPIGHGRSRAADPCMASRFRIRSRVASLWRRDAPSELMSTPPAPSAGLLPISTVLTMAGVTRPLSDCFNDAIAALAAERLDSAPTSARTGVRVGASGEWFVLATGADGSVVSYTPFGAATPTECDARLSYRDERTFAAMMDDTLGSTAAVATGRLRVSGSIRLANPNPNPNPSPDPNPDPSAGSRRPSRHGASSGGARRRRRPCPRPNPNPNPSPSPSPSPNPTLNQAALPRNRRLSTGSFGGGAPFVSQREQRDRARRTSQASVLSLEDELFERSRLTLYLQPEP